MPTTSHGLDVVMREDLGNSQHDEDSKIERHLWQEAR
jgi:hypothetical protein